MKGLGRNTFEDFRYDVPKRAFGTEVEYTHRNEVTRPFRQRYMQPPLGRLIDHMNPDYAITIGRDLFGSAITSNGGELYLDGTMEFATPECATPNELVQHERAGEIIVADTVDRIAKYLGTKEKVFKRSGYKATTVADIAFDDETIGYHENYTSINVFTGLPDVTRTIDMTHYREARHFSDFLALRKLIDGAGMVANDHFSLSQKGTAINYDYYTFGTRQPGKSPFDKKGSRLEVRSGESSKSDWATEFTVGLTSLVLRLIEHQCYPEHLALKNPNDAVRRITRNPKAAVMLESGLAMRGIDVLKEIVEEAYGLVSTYPDMPEYEEKAYYDFQKFYADMYRISLRDNDVKALADRINWAARFDFLIRTGATYDAITSTDIHQLSYDLVWDRVGEKDIARRILSRLGLTALTATVPEPPRTRAATRLRIARELHATNNLKRVKWHEVIPQTGDSFLLGGPLNTQAISSSD